MMGSFYFFQGNDLLLMSCNMNSRYARKKKHSYDLFVNALFPLWQGNIDQEEWQGNIDQEAIVVHNLLL